MITIDKLYVSLVGSRFQVKLLLLSMTIVRVRRLVRQYMDSNPRSRCYRLENVNYSSFHELKITLDSFSQYGNLLLLEDLRCY